MPRNVTTRDGVRLDRELDRDAQLPNKLSTPVLSQTIPRGMGEEEVIQIRVHMDPQAMHVGLDGLDHPVIAPWSWRQPERETHEYIVNPVQHDM